MTSTDSSRPSSINSRTRGPVRIGKMHLVHAPGHIFWKKKPKVDKLSLYLERMVEERANNNEQQQESEQDAAGAFDAKVQRVVERLLGVLFTEDLMFVKMFGLPPKDVATNSLYLQKVNDKEFDCRLYLRRFVDQEQFQLLFGAQSDVPPGMALYRAHPAMTSEQRAFLEDEWSPVMDGDGFMSPAKMYPWFAMGIANAVTIIRAADDDNANGNDDSGSQRSGNESLSDFAGVEVVGDFPVVRLLFPPDARTQRTDSDDVTLSVANSTQSLPDVNTQQPPGEEEKARARRPTPLEARPDSTLNSPGRPGAARPHGGRGDISKRTDQSDALNSAGGGAYGHMTVWSSESGEVVSCEQDIAEVPLMITIRPAIKGYGLPAAVKLQHGLPKQKPYCEKGLECMRTINNLLEDGQSMWYIQAAPVEHSENVTKSARFRSLFHKLGRNTKFWHVSLSPIEDIISAHTKQAYAEHEFPIDLEVVRASVQTIRDAQGWSCINDRLIDTAMLCVVKHNMLTMRGEGQCCLKVLEYLHGVIKSRSCPGFLLPNVNIATRITAAESAWMSRDMQQVLTQIQRQPGYVMSFVGFNKQSDDTANCFR